MEVPTAVIDTGVLEVLMRSSLLGLTFVFVLVSVASAQDAGTGGSGGTNAAGTSGGVVAGSAQGGANANGAASAGTGNNNGNTSNGNTSSGNTSSGNASSAPPPPVTAQGTAAPPASAPASQQPAQPPPSVPPPAVAPPPAPAPAARPKDNGRESDILWLEGFFGYSYADLAQFSHNNFLPKVDRFQGGGFAGGLAAGFRVSFLMFGVRGAFAHYSAFDLGTAVFEVHLRIPLPTIEPYVRAGIGYGWVGRADVKFNDASTGSLITLPKDSTKVYGLVVEAAAGLDVFLSKVVAIGAGVDADYLNLTRQRVDKGCSGTTCMPTSVNLQKDGDSVGLQLRVHAHISLHF